jgi:penicillin-binding protein 1A
MTLFTRIIKLSLLLSLVLALLIGAFIGVAYWTLAPSLPSIDTLRDARLQVPLRIYSAEGSLIGEYGEMRRIPVRYNDIPPVMVKAFLAAEDDRFFEHPGFDYQGLLRAGLKVVSTGERSQGGSTITMQLARNFFLSREKTYLRKLREIFLSIRIENSLSKQEILELYLNKIYLGNRAYGVAAAAQVYYGSSPRELDLAQTAMIAGLPKAPSKYNPIINPQRALERRNYVLRRMLEVGFISSQQYSASIAQTDNAYIHGQPIDLDAPYVAEMARDEMIKRYGQTAYTDGYHVTVTLRDDHQRFANHALRQALLDYDQRHGYRGAEARAGAPDPSYRQWDQLLSTLRDINGLRPAIVTRNQGRTLELYLGQQKTATLAWEDIRWARRYLSANSRGPAPNQASDIAQIGDVIRIDTNPEGRTVLSQIPHVEGAIVAVDPTNGQLTALVGGFDYARSSFNRATQSKRQIGSAFKPFLYSAALEKGYTTATLINDTAIALPDPSRPGGVWRPENYSGKFHGPTRMREALVQSLNLISIRILQDIGIEHAIQHLTRFGFNPNTLPHNLPLALGTAEISPFQLAGAYAVFANRGNRIEPYFIQRIENDRGEILFNHENATRINELSLSATVLDDEELIDDPNLLQELDEGQMETDETAISPQNSYIMTSMMQDVIKRGTAQKAMQLKRNDLAGKTGTTNEQRDAWFAGYSPKLVAVAWVGFDQFQPLGDRETGGAVALPMWMYFMADALKATPEQPFEPPPGIVSLKIDPDTGYPSSAANPRAIYEQFMEGSLPRAAPPSLTPNGAPADTATELF